MKSFIRLTLSVLWLLGSIFGSAVAEDYQKRLQTISDEMNTTIVAASYSSDGQRWEAYQLGRERSGERAWFRSEIHGQAFFAGDPVAGTPLQARLHLTSRGLSRIRILVDGEPRAEFAIDGSNGRAAEKVQDFMVAEQVANKTYAIIIEVHNQGFLPARSQFWPEQRQPLAEEGIWTTWDALELSYPAASHAQEVKEWLTAMQIAHRLLNPELVRYTFTGKPYPIPDRRSTAKFRIASLNAELSKAVLAFDLEAHRTGDWPKLKASLEKSFRLAKEIKAFASSFQVRLIGDAHIDIAWLWRMAETEEVARNTFRTVIANMAEYPELHYAQSQAITYSWIEKRDPELFEQIRQKVREGRWEIVGGMWVEPDCNLISGESWVRQLLFGKNYFRDKFGVDVRIGWNPDSFGYNWNMPQIYKKSGIDAFITQKLRWNDTTIFPHFLFWWQGADGSRLLTYLPPLSYDSTLQLPEVLTGIGSFEATSGSRNILLLYGIGDHGGGPNREILDRVRSWQKLPIVPNITHGRAWDFLTETERQLGRILPVWNNELYLEYHQGTFTTQGAIKKNNRLCESRLASTEKLAAIAQLLGQPYPAIRLHDAWQTVLTHQFHDILPGSSITAVYRDAIENYGKAQLKINSVANNALGQIMKQIDTSKADVPLLVFNPLSWERSDYVRFQLANHPATPFVLHDPAGKEIPYEILPAENDQGLEIAFIAEKVPAIGYRLYAITAGQPAQGASDVLAGQYRMENSHYRLEINPQSGNLRSIFSKTLKREMVAAGQEANRLWVYEDKPERWDAWNIGYTGRGWELNQADRIELESSTPVRATYRVEKSFLGLSKDRYAPTEDFPSSFFTQHITLYRNLDRIDIHTEADWWEDHLSLKALFPLAVSSDYAAYEIPYAAIYRTTRFQTLFEKARFEVPALRWADLADSRGGLSLLNDGKYGYDIHGNTMKISLLRSPTWPDPLADRGRHSFTYALYAHGGNFANGRTVHCGLELNQPLLAMVGDRHAGALPAEYSFFSVAAANVILDTIKIAEDGSGLILRLYEAHGNAGPATVTFAKLPKVAEETDLLEKPWRSLALQGNRLELNFAKFEIRTIKVRFQ